MKTLTLYNGYKLVHDRNQFGSHDWTLRDRDGDTIVAGNVGVSNRLRNLWPHDSLIEAIASSMYVGNREAAEMDWSLGDQRYLSIGIRCRKRELMCKTWWLPSCSRRRCA